jgi:hypothetical protein
MRNLAYMWTSPKVELLYALARLIIVKKKKPNTIKVDVYNYVFNRLSDNQRLSRCVNFTRTPQSPKSCLSTERKLAHAGNGYILHSLGGRFSSHTNGRMITNEEWCGRKCSSRIFRELALHLQEQSWGKSTKSPQDIPWTCRLLLWTLYVPADSLQRHPAGLASRLILHRHLTRDDTEPGSACPQSSKTRSLWKYTGLPAALRRLAKVEQTNVNNRSESQNFPSLKLLFSELPNINLSRGIKSVSERHGQLLYNNFSY